MSNLVLGDSGYWAARCDKAEARITELEAALGALGDMSCDECGQPLNEGWDCPECRQVSAIYRAALSSPKGGNDA